MDVTPPINPEEGQPLGSTPPAFAKSKAALGRILGCNRKTIGVWMKKDGAPKPRENGSHCVEEWVDFIRDNGLRGHKTEESVEDLNDVKQRKLTAEADMKELDLEQKKGTLVSVDSVKQFYGIKAGQVQTILRNKMENELPPILEGLSAVEIKQVLGRVLNEVVKSLNTGEIDD